MFAKLREVVENKAFRKLFIRSGLFSYILIAEVVFLGLLINTRGKDLGIKVIFSDFPVNFLIFFILFFIAMSHKNLFKVKLLKDLTKKQFIPFFLVNLAAVFTFYAFTQYLIDNPAAGIYSIIFTFLWWMFGAAIIIFLALAFFDIDYIKYLAAKKHLLIAGLFAVILAFLVGKWLNRTVWYSYSVLVARLIAKIVIFLLGLFLDGVSYTLDAQMLPTVTVPGFSAKIGTTCSGVNGIVLWIILFSIFALIEYKRLDIVKVLVLYPVGVVFMFLTNVLRVFSIFIAGHYINPRFAMGIFHKNVGWVLFTTYFLAFIYITHPWMKKKEVKKK